MWKQILDFTKSVASTYRRLIQLEDTVKKLQTQSEEYDDEQQKTQEMLRYVLYEFQNDKLLAEKDREILLLRLDAALKSDARALPPVLDVPPAPSNHETRIAALEEEISLIKQENAELRQRLEALEAPKAKRRRE